MKRFFLTLLIPAWAIAGQDHTCQGGHNCGTTPDPVESVATATAAAESDATAEGGYAMATADGGSTSVGDVSGGSTGPISISQERSAPALGGSYFASQNTCEVNRGGAVSVLRGGLRLDWGREKVRCAAVRDTTALLDRDADRAASRFWCSFRFVIREYEGDSARTPKRECMDEFLMDLQPKK